MKCVYMSCYYCGCVDANFKHSPIAITTIEFSPAFCLLID